MPTRQKTDIYNSSLLSSAEKCKLAVVRYILKKAVVESSQRSGEGNSY